MGRFGSSSSSIYDQLLLDRNWPIDLKNFSPEAPLAAEAQAVRAAIGVAQSAVRGDDVVAAAATVRSARLAGVDAVRFLRHLVRDDAVAISYRTRAACALLEVGGFLSGGSSAETKSSTAVRDAEGDGASGCDAA